MSCIVKYKRKGTNNLYAYESTSYWVPGLGPRTKKKYLGRVDAKTGNIIPSKKRAKAESSHIESGVCPNTEVPVLAPDSVVPDTKGGEAPAVADQISESEISGLKSEIIGLRTDVKKLQEQMGKLTASIEETESLIISH